MPIILRPVLHFSPCQNSTCLLLCAAACGLYLGRAAYQHRTESFLLTLYAAVMTSEGPLPNVEFVVNCE